jgi:hypothetical protein
MAVKNKIGTEPVHNKNQLVEFALPSWMGRMQANSTGIQIHGPMNTACPKIFLIRAFILTPVNSVARSP